MARGLVSTNNPEDDELSDKYDIYNIAIEFGDSLSEVENWRTNKIEWAKTILRVRASVAKSKVK